MDVDVTEGASTSRTRQYANDRDVEEKVSMSFVGCTIVSL